jgi:hypothetical protein
VQRLYLFERGHVAQRDIDVRQAFAEPDNRPGNQLERVHAETQAQTSGFTASDASGVRQQIIPIADDIECLGLK